MNKEIAVELLDIIVLLDDKLTELEVVIIVIWVLSGLGVVLLWRRIESKLDKQAKVLDELIRLLSSDNSPNLPTAEDVRGILTERKDGEDG